MVVTLKTSVKRLKSELKILNRILDDAASTDSMPKKQPFAAMMYEILLNPVSFGSVKKRTAR
jgi:NH3-dependent NAD+ synthetase